MTNAASGWPVHTPMRREGPTGAHDVKLASKLKMEMLAAVPLFAGLSKRQLQDVARGCMSRRWPADCCVVPEDTKAQVCYIIVEGTVDVRRHGRSIAKLGPGDFFGEIALFDPGPRSATVTTTSEMTSIELFAAELLGSSRPQRSDPVADARGTTRSASAKPPANSRSEPGRHDPRGQLTTLIRRQRTRTVDERRPYSFYEPADQRPPHQGRDHAFKQEQRTSTSDRTPVHECGHNDGRRNNDRRHIVNGHRLGADQSARVRLVHTGSSHCGRRRTGQLHRRSAATLRDASL